VGKQRLHTHVLNPLKWLQSHEKRELQEAMNRTTEIMANRLELFGGISNEKGILFGLTNGKQSFSVDMNTILMCLEVAETDGDTSTSGDRSSRTPHVTLTRTHDIDPHMIIGVMQQLSLWASWEASEPGTAFFFKQWGAWGEDGQRRSKKRNGRIFQGRTWDYEPSGEGVLK
jgi:hypothetical protein